MKRIDRIFGALCDSDKICEENNNDGDRGFKMPPVIAIACKKKHGEADKSLAVQPSMSSEVTLTTGNDLREPLLTAIARNEKHDVDMIDSPLAPLFSPLTPLVAKKKTHHVCESNQENSSPVRPMTPDTLELFHTLQRALEDDGEFENRKEEQGQEATDTKNINKYTLHQDNPEQISDFSSDTDSDYVPKPINRHECSSSTESIATISEQDNDAVDLVNNSEKGTTNGNIPSTSSIQEEEGHKNMANTNSFSRQVLSDSEVECDLNNETLSNDNLNKEVELEVNEGRPKRGRKRKHKDHTLAQTKERKYANLPYHGKKKFVESKIFHDYTCTCIKLCHLQVSKEKRQQEFQKFVTLGSYEAQLLYIVNSVTESPKARAYTVVKKTKTNKKRPREYSRKYTICDIEVCKDMYINNFQISSKKIDVTLKKNRTSKTLKDQKGQERGGWNKTKDEDFYMIKEIINAIPKYESHYRREQNSNCQYLKPGTTVAKIYNLYVEKLKDTYGEDKKPVSFATLKRIFTKYFNLRCKNLKKDTCSKCDTLTNKIKNSTTDDEQLRLLKEDKEKHLKRAEELRNSMNNDLAKAKIDESFECLTFDLEKTLPLPRIPTSIVFYKRQLWLYNCGIHAGSTDCGHCYVWIEGEAGRGAQEVASCLINYIKNKLDPKVEHLALWSDCCGGQNRNIKIVLMLKAILKSHPTLKTITLNYLESGHTFLPNDTDFSKIETQLKFHERIYTADEYINVIKSCKKKNPLQVYKMTREDFLSSKDIEKKIVNRKTFVNKNKTNWLKTKQIMLKKEDEYAVFMKTTLNEDQYQELNIEKKVKGRTFKISESDFSVLWPNGKEIPQAKLDDLKSMFDLIPKDCLGFYKSLKGNEDIVDDVDGYDGPVDFNIETQDDEDDDD